MDSCHYQGCAAEATNQTVEGWLMCDMHLAYFRSVQEKVLNEDAPPDALDPIVAALPPPMIDCTVCGGTGKVSGG